MRIAAAQINPTVGDLAGNSALIRRGIELAQEGGARLAVFPELAICGYPPEDLLFKDHFVRDCEEAVRRLAADVGDNLVAIVGCPLWEGGLAYNGAAVLSGGSVRALYRKIRLPNYAVFDEDRYFASGERVLVLQMPEGRVAVNICEDIWDAGGPSEEAALRGEAGLIVNISMSPYHFGKGQAREKMLAERACDSGAYVVYLNGVGGQDELIFDGQSLVFDPSGVLRARLAAFAEEVQFVEVDLEEAAGVQGRAEAPARWPVDVVSLQWAQPAFVEEDRGPARANRAPGPPPPPLDGSEFSPPAWLARRLFGLRAASAPADPPPPLERLAELYAALQLGVRDYTEKNGFQHAVLGLSGGIDSALTALIAVDALGPERVTGVSMPSRFTSSSTRSDAELLAERNAIDFREIPIEDAFTAYLKMLSPHFAGTESGVAEENLQARTRGNLLMALSNKFGWLVLTTGNKSEMATGYATLYGDMAGGYAVIKDVPKTIVYQLAEYRNGLEAGREPIPLSTITRPPSAELRADQRDQDSLPPYEILDQIVEAYVILDESIEEIVARGLSRADVEQVITLIDRNEYKRRQAPPGPRVTSKAFGKDRRLPITNRYRG